MRISYLNNRVKNIEEYDKKYIKYFGIIFALEIIVSFVLCWLVKNSMFDIEVYSTYYLNRISEISVNREQFFCYVYFQFIKEYLIFVIVNMTSYRRIGNILFLLFKLVSLIISLCIFVLKFGVLGQLIFIATLFPHSIIVVLFIIFVMKYNANKGQSNNRVDKIELKHSELYIMKKQATVILVNILAMVFFGFFEAYLESYINVWILDRLF